LTACAVDEVKALVRKLIEEDSSDVIANFDEPSDAAELGIQIRIMAPKDVVLELQKLLSQHGFTAAGSRPEKGLPDRERAYLIANLKQFRAEHGFGSLLPELRQPAVPKGKREELEKTIANLETEIQKLATAAKEADPIGAAKAKAESETLKQALTIGKERLRDWTRYDQQILAYNETTRKFGQFAEIERGIGAEEILCERCGAPLKLIGPGIFNSSWWGKETNNNEWARWSISTVCTSPRCLLRQSVYPDRPGERKVRGKSLADGYIPTVIDKATRD
jgi:hypothetical protein